MKTKNIFIFALMLFNCIALFSSDFPFDYQRLLVDFKGVAYNGSSILAYGTGGIILRSVDLKGKWEQIQAASDEYTINHIINKGKDYFGILDRDFIIKSADDGETWSLNKISVSSI